MAKILCPFHEDNNPSMELYADGHAYCFVCLKTWRPDAAVTKGIVVEEKEPEDIAAAIEEIQRLPVKEVRGLYLPVNDNGYFIVWEDREYYKFRTFQGNPKYIAPRGHKQPLFFLSTSQNPQGLVIVEGELNALSIARVATDLNYDIVSPGPAGNFTSQKDELVALASNYQRIVLWTDQDAAGIKALWALGPKLASVHQTIAFINSETDANEILVTDGPEGLHKVLEQFTGENN